MERLAQILHKTWWVLLLRGIVAIVFGVLCFAMPGISLASLILVFGAFVMADGILTLWSAFTGRGEHEHWWLLLLQGLLGVGVGLLAFFAPGVTALALLFYIAAWAIATGVLQIIAAIRLRKEIEGEIWLGLGGALSVLFGVLLMARPGTGALAVLWLIGAYAVAIGIIMVILAFKSRSFSKKVESIGAPAAA